MANVLPRVTSILKDSGLVTMDWVTQEDLDRGSAVHAATQFYDEGDLDVDTLDPTVAPRFNQYLRFLREVNPKILAIEETVENLTYGYMGHLDRRVVLADRQGRAREGILDIKGPTESVWHGLQISAYSACFKYPLARWTLHLHDDKYKLIEHKNRLDWEVFKAALTLVKWRNGNAS